MYELKTNNRACMMKMKERRKNCTITSSFFLQCGLFTGSEAIGKKVFTYFYVLDLMIEEERKKLCKHTYLLTYIYRISLQNNGSFFKKTKYVRIVT